jgi:phosphatidylglycerol:prolipoprotein diacylglycerol transferase
MYPILGRYGPLFLYSYSVTLAVGIAASLGLTARLAHRRSLPGWFDGILVASAAALAGGRIGYVLAHPAYFAENPAEAWQLWLGGLSYHGALLAGLAAFWIWSRWQRKPFLLYGALLAPGLALLAAAGWAACWLEGCAYGMEAPAGLLSASLADEFGVVSSRYQTQAIGLVLSLGVFGLLLGLWARRAAGGLFWPALVGLSLIHGLTSLLRGDPASLLLNWRVDVWIDFGVAIIALLGYGWTRFAKEPV